MKTPKLVSIKENTNAAIFDCVGSVYNFAVNQIISIAKKSIAKRGTFHLCLSGGSTPREIYTRLCKDENAKEIDWSLVHIYFGDERNVAPDSSVSNYNMAMKAGFNTLNIPSTNIHRMKAEKDLAVNAKEYESVLTTLLPDGKFDLMLLGLGHDGHTASLFPGTSAVSNESALVVENYVPEIQSHRMTLTVKAINSSRNITFYVIGGEKTSIMKKIAADETNPKIPATLIGSNGVPTLYLLDMYAGEDIITT